MKKQFSWYRYLFTALMIFILASCTTGGGKQTLQTPNSGSQSPSSKAVSTTASSANGDDATHGKDVEPNYSVVFPQEAVNRIDITLSTEAWADLQTEMTEQFGERGAKKQDAGRPAQMPGGQEPPKAPGNFQPGNPPGDGNMGKMDFGDTSYVSSTVTFKGDTWKNVGFRYSGNSTLQNSWQRGTNKISFRLDFDEFEDEDPSVTDQRFYGFKQLSFKSNAMDDSYLREKVVGDIFREAGVVSAKTTFYEVYVDYGEGSKYIGLYTVVEVVDDTVIQTQFTEDDGNVYKPEGSGAGFVKGTFDQDSFEKQTNKDKADWSDIQAVFSALHSDLRTSDPAAWRAGLEAVFDVDSFIRWLAVDTIIQNWDTYGAMAHNYYLYTNPANGRVTWIPWDNNMALSAKSTGQGEGNRGGPGGKVREVDVTSVSDQWPLISYLMDDSTYLEKYQQYLKETIGGAFQPEKLAAAYQKYHNLIAPFVEKEVQGSTQLESIEKFNQSVDSLIQHANERYKTVGEYLKAK
ncbi:MAG: CotH kinase family protein [Bacteroidales bacterium]